jgi:hypothetical protein
MRFKRTEVKCSTKAAAQFPYKPMKTLILSALFLLPVAAYGQTVKGPVTANFAFNHSDYANTDYYELCNVDKAQVCQSQIVVQGEPTVFTFSRLLSDGPHTWAVRACNVVACSDLSNTVVTPKIVTRGPDKPTTFTFSIQPE